MWTWPSALLFARVVKEEPHDSKLDILDRSANIDAAVPIASLAKNMTAYLVFEALEKGDLKPDTLIPINPAHRCLKDNAFAAAVLPRGLDHITVAEALTLLLRQSNNTMALVLADAVAGDAEKFTVLMNKMAHKWGMDKTRFQNPHGLPQGDRTGEYSTARDLATMGAHLLHYEDNFRTYSHEALKVAGKQVGEKASAPKDFLRSVGAVFKTATISGCHSLMTFFNVGDEKYLALNLCSSQNRYSAVIDFVKERLTSKQEVVGSSPAVMQVTRQTDGIRLGPPYPS